MLSTWSKALLSGLALMSGLLQAQTEVEAEGSWQHADGVWLGWQKSSQDSTDRYVYLVDNGTLQLNRSVPARSHVMRLSWTLGLGEKLNRFFLLDAQTVWERSFGIHRLRLGLNAGGGLYHGSTRYTNLEDQYTMSDNFSLADNTGVTARWGTDLSLSDTVALSRSMDLTLQGNRQESRGRVTGEDQSQNIIEAWGASLEKRWAVARFQAGIRGTELDSGSDLQGQNLQAGQNVREMQARFIFPWMGAWNGTVGWQELRSRGSDGDDRRLSGPEAGLLYKAEAAWTGSLVVRAMREDGRDAGDGEVFGEVNLAYRIDARNSFLVSLSRQLDLIAAYRIFADQNLVVTDEQRSSITGQVQWTYEQARYRLNLSLLNSRQEFSESDAEYSDYNISQTYAVTRLGEFSVVIGARGSRFDTDAPPVTIRRRFTDVRVGWQETLTGGARPLGGRMFYRLDVSYENLQEKITAVSADRLTFFVSFGQLGNF